MIVLSEPNAALPLVTVGVTFMSGRLHEPEGREGLARITAGMLRRGADGLTGDQIESQLDGMGAELGEHVGLGMTTFQVEALRRSLEPAVDLFARLLASPRFAEDELGRAVRQAEAGLLRARDDDALLASRALRRHLFAGHPHALRVSGTPAGLGRITQTDVQAFAAASYARKNAIVHVCGDATDPEAARIAERILSGLSEGERREYPAAEPPAPRGRRLVIVDKPERTQTQLGIGTLGTHPHDDDHVALIVANAVLGGTFSSRLTQEVRAERGWSYGASSHLGAGRVREAFSMWTAPAAEDAADCLALELELLDAWHDSGITADELAFCQSYLRRSNAFEIDTPKKRLHQKLERAVLDLPDDFHARFPEYVGAVTLDAANAAIRRRVHAADLWVSAVATAEGSRESLTKAVPDLAEVIVEPWDLE